VVSTGAKFVEQTWTGVVLAALDQSDLPAFLLYSGRLSHQVMSASAHGLDVPPRGPAIAPLTFFWTTNVVPLIYALYQLLPSVHRNTAPRLLLL
jgi:hypothetical protein